MTTLLTITTAVMAVCAAALGWRCVRLRKELKRETELKGELTKVLEASERRKSAYERLCEHPEEGMLCVEYKTRGTATVMRTGRFNGEVVGLNIKTFYDMTDRDMGFLEREAEELLDKLNEE